MRGLLFKELQNLKQKRRKLNIFANQIGSAKQKNLVFGRHFFFNQACYLCPFLQNLDS